jgi:hypothetical protein
VQSPAIQTAESIAGSACFRPDLPWHRYCEPHYEMSAHFKS